MKFLKKLFAIDKKPVRGLLMLEWAMLVYAALTLLYIVVAYTRLEHPSSLLWLRVQTVVMTLALWGVYRMVPCRLTMLARVIPQIALLGVWYPETFELNRILPNLDHVFAGWEQQLFDCQPALLFSQKFPDAWVSEPLIMGYDSYFLFNAGVPLYFFLFRYERFLKAVFIMQASFFLFYTIFVLLPVAGPQYYYLAAGIDEIAHGVFPNIGTYFETHSEALPTPGYADGPFYHILQWLHTTGERPTAAFPSSHMGITTLLILTVGVEGNRRLMLWMLPLAVLMFFGTFYIQAHYAIDAIAGVLAGIVMFFLFKGIYRLFGRE